MLDFTSSIARYAIVFLSQLMNQRKSFRCKVFGPAAQAELQLGKLKLACRLLDESAGGFAALVCCAHELTVGTVGRLSHCGGCYEVKVVHATRLKPAPKTSAEHLLARQGDKTLLSAVHALEASPSAARGSETSQPAVAEASAAQPEEPMAVWRLGLERLGEVLPPAPSPINWRVIASLIPLPRLMVRNIPLFIGGITLAVAVIAGPLFLVLHWPKQLRWTSRASSVDSGYKPSGGPSSFSPTHTDGKQPPSPNYATPDPRLPIAELAAQLGRATGDRAQETLLPDVGATRGDDPAHIGRLLARLPGATPFELPQVADKLGLTAEQRSQIRRIVNDCARTIEALEQQAAGASRQHIARYRQAILDKARAEALQLLTPEQMAQWKQLATAAKATQSDKQP